MLMLVYTVFLDLYHNGVLYFKPPSEIFHVNLTESFTTEGIRYGLKGPK